MHVDHGLMECSGRGGTDASNAHDGIGLRERVALLEAETMALRMMVCDLLRKNEKLRSQVQPGVSEIQAGIGSFPSREGRMVV